MDEKEQKAAIINAQLLSALVNIETAQSLILSQFVMVDVQSALYEIGLISKDIYIESLQSTIDTMNLHLDKINEALAKIAPEGGEEE